MGPFDLCNDRFVLDEEERKMKAGFQIASGGLLTSAKRIHLYMSCISFLLNMITLLLLLS